MKNIFQFILIFILLASCGQVDEVYVRFDSSQPSSKKPLSDFNKKIVGEYENLQNPRETLVITENQILKKRIWKFSQNRHELELDSNAKLDINDDSQLTDFFENNNYTISIYGDSLVLETTFVDTVFSISESEVLKKTKGSYFLNFQKGENKWEVMKLELKQDSIFVGAISPADTLLQFDFVVKTETIEIDSSTTTEYLVNPKNREFKRLLKQNTFENTKCYIRIKNGW
jgi:hypothetical protein